MSSTARASLSIYIHISSVLGHGANSCRVQNGQDGRPLRCRCVRLKYSPRIASHDMKIVRKEADTTTSPSGKDTGVGIRNHANYSSSTLENFTGTLTQQSLLQPLPLSRACGCYLLIKASPIPPVSPPVHP